jgi:hypothetical protein
MLKKLEQRIHLEDKYSLHFFHSSHFFHLNGIIPRLFFNFAH